MSTFLLHFLTLNRPVGYALVFLGVMIEGDLFLLTTSFLSRTGYFDIFDLFITAFFGTLSGDCLWFYLGRKAGKENNKISAFLNRRVKKLDIDFRKNFFRKLLLTKFMYGTHHLAVAIIGMSGMDFKKYIKKEIPAIIIWIFVIGGAGYLLSEFFHLLKIYLGYAEIILLSAVFTYFIITKIINKKHF